MRLAVPFIRLTKTLVPVHRKDVETEVIFRTQAGRNGFWFHRHFTLGPNTIFKFVSCLEQMGGNQVIEWMGSLIGWHPTFAYKGDRVQLDHVGYAVASVFQCHH
ncbi:hypothetical protein [Sulfitobacter pacificus]|uniref:hypothetical protein n=1 Tax=Sulfitobacter pacificus TaxID=1499314 RepID=UPI003101FFE4